MLDEPRAGPKEGNCRTAMGTREVSGGGDSSAEMKPNSLEWDKKKDIAEKKKNYRGAVDKKREVARKTLGNTKAKHRGGDKHAAPVPRA